MTTNTFTIQDLERAFEISMENSDLKDCRIMPLPHYDELVKLGYNIEVLEKTDNCVVIKA